MSTPLIHHSQLTWLPEVRTFVGEISTVSEQLGDIIEIQGKTEKRKFIFHLGLEFTDDKYIVYMESTGIRLKLFND